MPLYEYRCQTCNNRFELRRSFASADEPASCPSGHDDAVRLLPVFASVGRGGGSSPSGSATGAPAGPCGAHCACHGG